MRYKVTYIEQRKVSVVVDINDKELNDEFSNLGGINSDSDFTGEDDPRWRIEQAAYDAYSSCDNSVEYGEYETIVDRSIMRHDDDE